jgi:glycosyltransferase involved in cell wall biosynthesis
MITLCMLTKSPPLDRMATLLDYVSPLVGQVVVVMDSRTKDEDARVVENMGAELVPFEWIDDFAAARNAALPKAKGDWILHLDPDELPSVDMLNFVSTVNASEWQPQRMWQGHPHFDPRGWLFFTRGYGSGVRDSEAEQDWHCRLFRRELGRWYKPVHEQVMLEGRMESATRETPILPKAPRGAYLIHSKMPDTDNSGLYERIEHAR